MFLQLLNAEQFLAAAEPARSRERRTSHAVSLFLARTLPTREGQRLRMGWMVTGDLPEPEDI